MAYSTPQLTLIGETAGVVLGTHRVGPPTPEFIVEPPATILYYDDQASLESEW